MIGSVKLLEPCLLSPKPVNVTVLNNDEINITKKYEENCTATDKSVSLRSIQVSINDVDLPLDWVLSERQLCDLELLLNKGLSPLDGYLCRNDYESVLSNMRLSNGTIWPIPIVFCIPQNCTVSNTHWATNNGTNEEATHGKNKNEKIKKKEEKESNKIVRLRDHLGVVVAELHAEEIYLPNIENEIFCVLGSSDNNHPYAKYLRENHINCYYVGGKVIEKNAIIHFDFSEYRLSPAETRKMIIEKICEKEGNTENDINIVGFQTRNPMHRSHFEMTANAIKEVEEQNKKKKTILLLTPTVGTTQEGDINYRSRVKCYKNIMKYYKNICDVYMVLIPIAMRMAGPREAVWHSIIRKNYGCTHFIVGRDHAGPSSKKTDGKSFYGMYDAQKLLQSVEDEIGVKTVTGKEVVYINENGCDRYVQIDKVPPGAKTKNISGTELRRMLRDSEDIPEWYTFKEVSAELKKIFPPKKEMGFCLYFTGLPCSGKSTLASALKAQILENEGEKRKVTILDADIIRTHLSARLGFDRNDRSINVRRIGYVASEIVKHNGICLVANIAPYEEDRQHNRSLIQSVGGGYIEVYVCTPLEICEKRDIKELYKKARQGIIKQFTGISDPYEIPTKCEISVDSSENIKGASLKVFNYLKENYWV